LSVKFSFMRALILTSALFLLSFPACAGTQPKNSLSQHTGEAGSIQPKARPPRYPNTAGNIVAPPGNPAGNDAGAPPIVGGTESQHGGWPGGR
jgi:hypothetical protein